MASLPTTVGIDLSAQPKATAVCSIEWGAGSARIVLLEADWTDDRLLRLVADTQPQKVAIDAPFGWPTPFVDAVSNFGASGAWPVGDDRRPLLLRTTDLVVGELTGTYPLSVSADKLGVCAMRCAHLLVELDAGGLDRTGAGLAAEVYPAAALRQWGLDPRRYKGSKPDRVARRTQLVDEIAVATSSWLTLDSDQHAHLARSDHLLDALISAIVGRAVALGLTLRIPAEQRALAAVEGWIHLPCSEPLAELNAF